MRAQKSTTWELIQEVFATAPSRKMAWRWLLEAGSLRIWMTLVACFPIEMNLRSARVMGSLWWISFKKHRERAMENLRASLGDEYSEAELRRIGRQSMEHFVQLYLVEMPMSMRLVSEWSWTEHVEMRNVGDALSEILSDQPTLMLTPHFGNYELLGYTVSRLGLPLSSIMRPLDNPILTDTIVRSRLAGNLELLFKKGAMDAAPRILESGGSLCFIADQDAGRKGVFSTFFGRPASWYKSIGIIAMRFRAPVVVSCAARKKRGTFQYIIEVERVIQPEEWDAQDNPLQWITDEFSSAIERMIRRHPDQYLWMHRRWKTQPRVRRPKATKPTVDTPSAA